ncbi:predicted protein [Nematostella vectensis]|uniref:Uncharacterized protein n=1 Tax=Nematostella vectensis TaxID=45351 RepID=A7RV96_NEMVE|nr:predicted protein [Nematostella vectensis]|eukprot:XP_001636668.1 predicted protein [Nematostella vectensis]
MSRSISTPDIYKVSLSRLDAKSVDEELLEVCMLSGVKIDPDVFKILLDLMKTNVSPSALVQILRRIAVSKGARDDPRSGKVQAGTTNGSVVEREVTASLPRTEAIANRLRELRQQQTARE